MTLEQVAILGILACALALFMWGRWRHDVVAMLALLGAVALGLVAPGEAFEGFGHPAVITVAAVLILSRGLFNSGAIDLLAHHTMPGRGPGRSGRNGSGVGEMRLILTLSGVAAFLSAFMNNVGALALMMPVVFQAAQKNGLPVGRLLMPVSFASILGGMTTLIGTPPNIIIAGFRAEAKGQPFGMFDFTPVGLAVAVAGIVFIGVIGWRLLPRHAGTGRSDTEPFDIARYFTEVCVGDTSPTVGKSLAEFETQLATIGGQVVGLVRDDERILAPSGWRRIRARDILVIEADSKALTEIVTTLNLELVDDRKMGEAALRSDQVDLTEVAVQPGSSLVGRTVAEVRLRSRFGVNLLALSRQGTRSWKRLRDQRLEAGDVLLLQGSSERITDIVTQFSCVPLMQRSLKFPRRRHTVQAAALMGAAVVATVAGVPAPIAFTTAAVAFVMTGLVPLRNLYDSIDWSVIVLLGALLPVAGAMQETGAAALIAEGVIGTLAGGSAVAALVLVMVISINLTDVMNNAATAAVMGPIAVVVAQQFGVNPDSFLMAVAIGASSAFLTPIGHQNNTLILGPGGYRFRDYWRMGLPLEVLVVAVGVPMILLAFPL